MIVQSTEPESHKTSIDRLAQIHPNASVGDGVVIGAGSVIEAGAVIQSGVVIGQIVISGRIAFYHTAILPAMFTLGRVRSLEIVGLGSK